MAASEAAAARTRGPEREEAEEKEEEEEEEEEATVAQLVERHARYVAATLPPCAERDKMIAGGSYDPADPQLATERDQAHDLAHEFGLARPSDRAGRRRLLRRLLPVAPWHDGGDGDQGDDDDDGDEGAAGRAAEPFFESPLYVDYGYNVVLGAGVFGNFGCTLLDVAPIVIGAKTMLAPHVQLLTAAHPLKAKARNSGIEEGKPIHIGRSCWLGGGVIVIPGVTIGDEVVVGAGSVVVKDVPDRVVVVGNPARIVRHLDDGESPSAAAAAAATAISATNASDASPAENGRKRTPDRA